MANIKPVKIKGVKYYIEDDGYDLFLMPDNSEETLVIARGWSDLLAWAENQITYMTGRDSDGMEIIDWDKSQAKEMATDQAPYFVEENFDKAVEVVY